MDTFKTNVLQVWGDKGSAWLKQLPVIIAALSKQWGLTELIPAANLSYNYLLFGLQQNRPVVLKIGFEGKAVEQEAAVLRAYQGQGCVALIAVDLTYNALLMEQAIPGKSLKTLFPLQDDKAVECAANVMKQLHAVEIPGQNNFSVIQDWLKDLATPHSALVNNYHLDKARKLSQELLTSSASAVLLHGDLHHDNIVLAANNTWKAIDPKGVIGEPAYEVGAFIRNPFPELMSYKNLANIMQRRLILFADVLEIDYKRLLAWSYVQAVLSACWAMQEGQNNAKNFMAVAMLLDDLN